LNLATEHLKTDLDQFLVMYKACKKWQENWSNWQKYCHFKISLLFLSKSNDNLAVDLTIPTWENYQKNRQYIFQIDKSLFKLTGYQVKMKIFLSISEIVKMKVKLVNYFLVWRNPNCNVIFYGFFCSK
jgi:hypothetical protein